MQHIRSGRLAALSLVLAAAACTDEPPPTAIASPIAAAAPGDTVETCGPGGYVTRVYVDPASIEVGDGVHFARITEAIDSVRAWRFRRGEKTLATTLCRITISVAPGIYTGAFAPSTTNEVLPLVLDVPRVTLDGAQRLVLDANGRATNNPVNAGQVTVLRPSAPLTGSQSLIIVTDSSSAFGGADDAHGDSVTVRGFEFRSGFPAIIPNNNGAGFAVFAMRVQGLIVVHNKFGFMFITGVDGRGTNALITLNSALDLGGGACVFCLGGPGTYTVSSNTVLRSGQVGVLAVPMSLVAPPTGIRAQTPAPSPSVNATITNNAISGNTRRPAGTGIRILATGAANLTGNQALVTVSSNRLANSTFGIIADAGFPGAVGDNAFGDITLGLSNNVFENNCQANMLVSLARHTRGMGVTTSALQAGYLKQSTYDVSLNGNLSWTDVWFSHPKADSGTTLNNTLIVDGTTLANGGMAAYNPALDACGASPIVSWIGVKNSDDVGTKFDVKTEITRHDSVVAVGHLDAISGGSSGFNNAVARTVAMAFSEAQPPAGDSLMVTVYVRIAEGVTGHTSGTARLWYGDAAANSRITTTIGGQPRTYYFTAGGMLADTPGTVRKFADVLVKKSDGNPFRAIGTWTKKF